MRCATCTLCCWWRAVVADDYLRFLIHPTFAGERLEFLKGELVLGYWGIQPCFCDKISYVRGGGLHTRFSLVIFPSSMQTAASTNKSLLSCRFCFATKLVSSNANSN